MRWRDRLRAALAERDPTPLREECLHANCASYANSDVSPPPLGQLAQLALGHFPQREPLPTLPPASAEQAEAEEQDRAAIVAMGTPATAVPVIADDLATWEAELAELLAATPAQRITDPQKAASYFATEARRWLAAVRHDPQAARLLMGFWRHARARAE